MSSKATSPSEFANELRRVADFVERHPELGTPDGGTIFYFREFGDRRIDNGAQVIVDVLAREGNDYAKRGDNGIDGDMGCNITLYATVPANSFVPVVNVTVSETTYYELPPPTDSGENEEER